jgi:hypothetical protein
LMLNWLGPFGARFQLVITLTAFVIFGTHVCAPQIRNRPKILQCSERLIGNIFRRYVRSLRLCAKGFNQSRTHTKADDAASV